MARAIWAEFSLAKIPGSGHRIRATYAVEQMRDEIRHQISEYGQVVDKHSILFIVAQRLGHANFQTLEHYIVDALDSANALAEELVHIPDKDVAKRVRRLLDLIGDNAKDVLQALDDLLESQSRASPKRRSRGTRAGNV